MSSLALMRWLESAPERYDRGMHVLTFGRVVQLHEAVADAAVRVPGDRVLEVGCGTGALTARMLERGACISAIDQSPAMIEQARARLGDGAARVEWFEQTAAEIDRFDESSFEAVVLCLCLSDMSADERAFVFAAAVHCLTHEGRLVVGDEVRAPSGWRRALQWLVRIPQAAAGWLLVGSVSRPLSDLVGEIRAAGALPVREERWLMDTLCLVVAQRGGRDG